MSSLKVSACSFEPKGFNFGAAVFVPSFTPAATFTAAAPSNDDDLSLEALDAALKALRSAPVQQAAAPVVPSKPTWASKLSSVAKSQDGEQPNNNKENVSEASTPVVGGSTPMSESGNVPDAGRSMSAPTSASSWAAKISTISTSGSSTPSASSTPVPSSTRSHSSGNSNNKHRDNNNNNRRGDRDRDGGKNHNKGGRDNNNNNRRGGDRNDRNDRNDRHHHNNNNNGGNSNAKLTLVDGAATTNESGAVDDASAAAVVVPFPEPLTDGPAIKYDKSFLMLFKDICIAKPESLSLDDEIDPEVPESVLADRMKVKIAEAAAIAERRKQQRSRREDAPLRDKFGRIVEIKPLEMHDNRWVPMQKLSGGDELVYKAARGILNKLTPENFGKLLSQFLDLGMTTANLGRGIVSVLFEKACMEHGFGPLYAEFCRELVAKLPAFVDDLAPIPTESEEASEAASNTIAFQDILVTHCIHEFNLPTPPLPEDGADKDEKIGKIRTREIGIIRFMGELFNKKVMGMEEFLPVLAELEQSLESLSIISTGKIEGLCRLLETCGSSMEHELSERLAVTIQTMQEAAQRPDIASRIKFMLLDTVDLWHNDWTARRAAVVQPKKLNQVKDTSSNNNNRKTARGSSSSSSSSSSSDRRRPQSQRSSNNNDSSRRSGRNNNNSSNNNRDSNEDNSRRSSNNNSNNNQTGNKTRFEALNKQVEEEEEEEEEEMMEEEEQYDLQVDTGAAAGNNNNTTDEEKESYATPIGGDDRDSFGTAEGVVSNSNSDSDEDSFGTPLSSAKTRRAESARNSSLEASDEDMSRNGSEDDVDVVVRATKATMEELFFTNDIDEAFQCISEICVGESVSLAAVVVREVASSCLEANVPQRQLCTDLLKEMVKLKGPFDANAFSRGLSEVLSILEDLIIDIPLAKDHLAEIVAACIATEITTLADLLATTKRMGVSNPCPGFEQAVAAFLASAQ